MGMLKKLMVSLLTKKTSQDDLRVLIGKIAIAETDLKPSGTVSIDGENYEVKTDGESVEAGRGVKVIRIQGKKIIVRRV